MKPTPATCAPNELPSEMAKSAAKSCGCPPVRLATTSLTMARPPHAQHINAECTGPVQVCDGPRRRNAAARAGSLRLAVLVEMAEIGPEIADLLGILHARKGHAGAGHLLQWIGDVFLEDPLAPGDAGTLHGIGIGVVRKRAGKAAVEAVERRSELDRRALARGMAREAPRLERRLAFGPILRQCGPRRPGHHNACYNPNTHLLLPYPPNDAASSCRCAPLTT